MKLYEQTIAGKKYWVAELGEYWCREESKPGAVWGLVLRYLGMKP